MPWIDKESCNGCGICVDECPADAIAMDEEQVVIDMAECIRCGVCHSICPQDSVKHDSEKIPELVQNNLDITKKYMDLCAQYLGDVQEKAKCLHRMRKHFNKEKIVAGKTLEELKKLENM
ncbi:MAG: 4Fe-4S binding protein [bacterium]